MAAAIIMSSERRWCACIVLVLAAFGQCPNQKI